MEQKHALFIGLKPHKLLKPKSGRTAYWAVHCSKNVTDMQIVYRLFSFQGELNHSPTLLKRASNRFRLRQIKASERERERVFFFFVSRGRPKVEFSQFLYHFLFRREFIACYVLQTLAFLRWSSRLLANVWDHLSVSASVKLQNCAVIQQSGSSINYSVRSRLLGEKDYVVRQRSF